MAKKRGTSLMNVPLAQIKLQLAKSKVKPLTYFTIYYSLRSDCGQKKLPYRKKNSRYKV